MIYARTLMATLTTLTIVCVGCGAFQHSGGIVDNGYKPEKPKIDPTTSSDSTLTRSYRILERYQITDSERTWRLTSKDGKSILTRGDDRAVFRYTQQLCDVKDEIIRTDLTMRVCGDRLSHLILSDGYLVAVDHNLEPKTIKSMLRTFSNLASE